MKRNSKSSLPPAQICAIFGRNIAGLRDKKFKEIPTVTKRNQALAALVPPTSKSQIQRMVKGEVAAGIDLVERLATALDCRPQDLLTPYFANVAYVHPVIPVQRTLRRSVPVIPLTDPHHVAEPDAANYEPDVIYTPDYDESAEAQKITVQDSSHTRNVGSGHGNPRHRK